MLSDSEREHIAKMVGLVPSHVKVIVIESNISTREDIEFVRQLQEKDPRVKTCLVGASILGAESPKEKIKELMNI